MNGPYEKENSVIKCSLVKHNKWKGCFNCTFGYVMWE